jgi:hypothetical protein
MALTLDQAGRLLDPDPMALEMGIEWVTDTELHVAARTDMPGCTGAMFEWWFRFAPDTRQYAWWHPLDHVSSEWVETSPETHVGSTHIVRERLGGERVLRIHIHFCDPAEIIEATALADARAAGAISGFVYARSAAGEVPARDAQGRPRQTRMAHVCRDTVDGMVLRSHWWLDHDRVDGEPARASAAGGLGLVKHCNSEFKYLSGFLPALYAAENRDLETPALPW